MRFSTLLLCLCLAAPALAQDDLDSEDLPVGAWQMDLVSKLAASQAQYSNWTEGGLNTLAFTSTIAGKAQREMPSWQEVHELRLSFGLVKQDTLDFRKAEDLIRLATQLQYRGDGFFQTFNPTVAAVLRTQFAPGFDYDPTASDFPSLADQIVPGERLKVSDFFSPAQLTQTLGLTYDPNEWFTQRFGVAARETVVMIERLRPVYGSELDEAVRWELGLESHSEVDRELGENISLQSRLSLFAAFNNPNLPDALWENVLAMKVNNWLTTDLEVVVLYDRDLSDRPQLKEVLSLGITFILI